MKIDKLLKMLLPEVLIENFDVVDSQRNENRLPQFGIMPPVERSNTVMK